MRGREIALSVTFAAVYAALTWVLAPISFGAVQCRIAEILKVVAIPMGWPVIFGVFVGHAIGNFAAPLGWLDFLSPFVFGLPGMVIMRLIYQVTKKQLLWGVLGGLIYSLMCGLWVGFQLWYFFGVPMWFGVPSVFAGEFVSVVVLGNIVALALTKRLLNYGKQ